MSSNNLSYSDICKLGRKAIKQAGSPDIVILDWDVLKGQGWIKKHDKGVMMPHVISINPNQSKECALNTIWHEIGHVLFPGAKDADIEEFAEEHSGYDYNGRAV